MEEQQTTTGDWVRLVVYTSSYGGPTTGTWHRHDGEATLCGFWLLDRAVFDNPPPGAKTCRFCQLAVGE